ncbi:MAG TPA: thioredoxin family protein, partial [Hyphomicrobiaceae bacterium]|nr:thioredoxin family protein [Hyphomicrobiaceae bacterium]
MRQVLVLLLCCFVTTSAFGAKLGEDGLHKQPWFSVTFKDVRDDLATAKKAGKRLAIIIEQRGCIYCKKLHETVFSDDAIAKYIADNFMVVQYNMFGDEEVIDLDGKTLTEKTAVRRRGLAFTPTIMFLPEEPSAGKSARDVAVNIMPGAFGKGTTLHMFQWVREKGYQTDE